MKTILLIASALTISACSTAPEAVAPSNNMAAMGANSGSAVKTGTASGKVTSLDKAGGFITIAHGPIPAVAWPAMTMKFKADPKILGGIKFGDPVEFELMVKGNDGTVTKIAKY